MGSRVKLIEQCWEKTIEYSHFTTLAVDISKLSILTVTLWDHSTVFISRMLLYKSLCPLFQSFLVEQGIFVYLGHDMAKNVLFKALVRLLNFSDGHS
jgi:predicted nucleotide-binding protein (sugar kinase/HSP70/actin superfamily)